ncbi:MAG TPA: hypothetical protein VFN19_10070 [Candidatus Nanopelagicales bacterium]|nr:hypothetical protein [Candidatus Nanopelagicales bacterium]
MPASDQPRRAPAFLAVVVVALVLVAVAAVIVSRRGGSPTLDSGRQALPGPVVLVPGYGGGTEALTTLAARLRAQGRAATVLHLEGDGTGDLREQAALLGRTVDALRAAGAPSVDVVGYSAGGIVARLWASDNGGAALARRIVLLGTPNHGAQIAGLGAAFGGALCPPGCRQLAPDSELLAGLNDEGLPVGPQWVSIWTTQDEVVTPPDSARIDGAVDVAVQEVCPSAQVAHSGLPTAPSSSALVLRALAVAPFTSPATCPG